MNLITITDNVATVAASISGIRGATGQEPDSIPMTPYVVVGLPKALVIPGDRTVTTMDLPMYVLIERLSGAQRDLRIAYGFVPTFVTTFAVNQSLSGTVQDATITGWDTNTEYTIAGATYWAVEFTLTVGLHEHVPQKLDPSDP